MDGNVKQDEMAEIIKREVKENAHNRRRPSPAEVTTGNPSIRPQRLTPELAAPICDILKCQAIQNNGTTPQHRADCTLGKNGGKNVAFSRGDTVLLIFYLEHLFPFLYPFYNPPVLEGGKAWILELMIGSPVVRQATLCQSSYFFCLAQGTANRDILWETVLSQTRDAFGVLGQALQVIDSSGCKDQLHGAVRILTSIMQVQRFEIAISSFNNCRSHLNAALALYKQLLDIYDAVETTCPRSRFNAIMGRLRSSSRSLHSQYDQIPSAEQAAFQFSSSLLILDDIIASTVLQEKPTLYEYHRDLLGSFNGITPPVNLETTVGCQNWVMLQIGEIAALDAWKQQCKRTGNLDVMELVRRATSIKDELEMGLTRLQNEPAIVSMEGINLLHVLTAGFSHTKASVSQSSLVIRVWAHAALLYLFVVVSGWQPASVDVRYHVGQIIELLSREILPPELLHTMVWPFCVAGCLAEPALEEHLRGMVEALQPPSVFGTVRKALEIMENVWKSRDPGDVANRDLATCFRSEGDLVLLV